jgi:uncharacterized protein YciI
MKYVLFYETADDVSTEQLMAAAPAHQVRCRESVAAGTLLAVGPFADRSGAMAVFTSRAAAEEFAAGDPFVTEGLMKTWSVREWLESVLSP